MPTSPDDPPPGSPPLSVPSPDVGQGPLPPVLAKIIISGGFGAGKTTAIGTLSEIEPIVTEAAMTVSAAELDVAAEGSRKSATTVAMDFGRLTLDDSLVLYLFGTPGQDRFGYMWPDLAGGALGGIVMVDSRRVADCFVAIDYFEQIGLPFVVAVNRFAGRETLPLDDVRDATNVDPDVPVIGVDARDHESMKAATLCLLDLVLARAQGGDEDVPG